MEQIWAIEFEIKYDALSFLQPSDMIRDFIEQNGLELKLPSLIVISIANGA